MTDYYIDKNGKVRKKKKEAPEKKQIEVSDVAPVKTTVSRNVPSSAAAAGDIAPTVNTDKTHNMAKSPYEQSKNKSTDDKKIKFFKGSKNFEDGYQPGDVFDTTVATVADVGVTALKGGLGVVEGLGDAATYGLAWIPDILGADKVADYMRDKIAKPNTVEDLLSPATKYVKPYSVFDRTTDSAIQGMGQMGLILGTGGMLGSAGLSSSAAGNTTMAILGGSSVGHGTTEAYQIAEETGKEISDEQAFVYGLGKGAIDTVTEMMFGGIGRGVNALGFNRGISSLDDAFAMKLSSVMSDQITKNAVEFGIKAFAEGAEEVIAGLGSAVLKKLTVMKDEDLKKLIEDENLLEQFVSATLSTAALQSGYVPGINSGSLRDANRRGEDYITGHTQQEQLVIDKVYEDVVKEKETNGKKLSKKEKNEIYEEVLKRLEKGYIDTETIESVLGGETYNSLKSATENETKLQIEYDSMKAEYDTLNKMKQMEMTGEQTERREELKNQLKKLEENLKNSSKTQIRNRLNSEMLKIVEGTKLSESYNEKSRRSQAFEADLTKYDAKQQEVIKKAAESGILNNTNRTHEFVDMIAKISADKGVSFDFVNNAKLKESGFAIEGKTVNGYVKDGNIAVNIDSKKALNTVVGHEITHVLEGTDIYAELQNVVKEYATTKGEYQTRYDALAELYKDVDGAVIENELTADLVGEYLFTDSDFVSRLSVEKPNIFKKIYEEIKYFLKIATDTKEAVQLEKVKRAFEKAYKESANKAKDINTVYLLFADENIIKKAEEFKRDGYKNFERVKITDVTERIKADVENLVGFDASGYEIYSTTDTFKHIEKRHGENGQHDQSMKDMRDVALMGYVLNNYDKAELVYGKDGKPDITYAFSDKNGDPSKLIKFSKEIDGTQYVVVATPENKYKKLWVVSEYKTQKKDTSQPSNDITALPPTSVTHSDNVSSKDIISDSSKKSSNIRYSLSDTKGRNLTEEQQEYFKDSKVRDENGNLKVMYHGSPAQFTVFDKKKTKSSGYYGRGFYFSESESHAGQYGSKYEVYLDLKNPVREGTKNITKEQLRKFVAELAENEDYGIENYGYDATVDSVTESVYGKDDFTMLGDLNATSVGDFAEAVKLFNEVNGTNYDGIIASTETVAFYPEQIKNISNHNPTDNPDINLSLGEQSAKAGDYRVYGKDIALSKTETTTPEVVAEIAPTTEGSLTDRAPLTEKETEREVIGKTEVAPAQQILEPKTVAERVEAKRQAVQEELDSNIQNRQDSYEAFTEKIENLQEKYNSKKNKDTKVANDLLRSIERTKRLRASIDADYSKRIADLEQKVEKMQAKEYATAMQRQEKQKQLNDWAENLIGDTSTWVDKKTGIQYKTNTLRRNLRDVVRDADGKRDIKKADAIYEELQGKYNHNEAELKRESAMIKKTYAEMKITKAEDAYIQMLGELRYNPDTKLKKSDVAKYYEKNKANIDSAKVDRAIEEARKTYDWLLERVNAVLREQGMKEIPYRKGYFPHFTEDKQSFLAKLLNWKTINTDIPTDIAGITETFKPNRSWQSFNKHRTGDSTDYSFLKGLDNYVHGSLDWIYHIEDIQKRRAFENQIRYVHSEQGIKDKIEAIKNDEMYDAEEAQEQIDLVYKEAGNPLHNFVQDLQDGTNALANKKSDLDRTVEKLANRKIYSTMTNISNRVTGNMVAGSVSSALTNFIPITQSWMEVSPLRSLQAMGETIRSIKKDDGIVEKSDYLTNRLREEEKLYKTGWDVTSKYVGILMDVVDGFTSQVVWRSKYIDNIANGMSENAAIKNADQFAENVMAGRSRGNMPTIFNSKNPLIKTLTAFQLEVANQYNYMFKDAPQDMKNEGLAKLTGGYIKMFLGAWAYNALYSTLTGRDAAFDPIGILQEFIGDLGGDDEEEKDVAGAIGGLASNVADEIPFIGGLLGGGRIPISSALPYDGSIAEAYADIVDGNKKSLLSELSEPFYYGVLPMGGGQIRKTVQGLAMFDDDLPVSGSYTKSGNLRFPVEDTFLNKLQAGVFGQYASKNAQEYFDRGQKALQEKQIKEYKEVDIPISQYWDYRDGLKGLNTLAEKGDYIRSLDLPIEKKNILINNIAKRETPIDFAFDSAEYENFEEFDFATRYPDKYNILKDQGISVKEYNEKEKETAFIYTDDYSWATKNPEKYAISKVISDDVKVYKQYTSEINAIKGEGAKKKKRDYIFSLDLDYGQKAILYRSLFNSKADKKEFNEDIVRYLDDRDDVSLEEYKNILEALEMTLHTDGTITW